MELNIVLTQERSTIDFVTGRCIVSKSPDQVTPLGKCLRERCRFFNKRATFCYNICILLNRRFIEALKISRLDDVICINECYILAACNMNTDIACTPSTSISYLVKNANVSASSIKLFTELATAICRRIIDQDDFFIRQILRENMVDTLLQIIPFVVDGHDDRYRDHAIPFFCQQKAGGQPSAFWILL